MHRRVNARAAPFRENLPPATLAGPGRKFSARPRKDISELLLIAPPSDSVLGITLASFPSSSELKRADARARMAESRVRKFSIARKEGREGRRKGNRSIDRKRRSKGSKEKKEKKLDESFGGRKERGSPFLYLSGRRFTIRSVSRTVRVACTRRALIFTLHANE